MFGMMYWLLQRFQCIQIFSIKRCCSVSPNKLTGFNRNVVEHAWLFRIINELSAGSRHSTGCMLACIHIIGNQKFTSYVHRWIDPEIERTVLLYVINVPYTINQHILRIIHSSFVLTPVCFMETLGKKY
jgi:hypothetical protein